MPAITKQKTKLHLNLTNSDHASAHGGQVLIDALCRRFDLWKRLQKEPSLDPRQRQNIGFTPAAVVAQLIFTLTSGGASLADAERIGQDRVLMNLLGLAKGADQTTLGEWLRAQTKESVQVLHKINAELVDWASRQAKPGRWLHAGQVEVFFDDSQIEVLGHKFEG
ncbi:MAG TPA: transposase, partial [Rhizomicrobium sp.]